LTQLFGVERAGTEAEWERAGLDQLGPGLLLSVFKQSLAQANKMELGESDLCIFYQVPEE